MEVLSQKGDIIEQLKALLSDKEKIKTEGLLLKQVFLEVVFTKFGMLSLEHVTRGVEKVKPVLEEFFIGQDESQKMALNLILDSFKFSDKQDYSGKNLFLQRNKIINLIERLNQLGILES
jgi:hypothetical protein